MSYGRVKQRILSDNWSVGGVVGDILLLGGEEYREENKQTRTSYIGPGRIGRLGTKVPLEQPSVTVTNLAVTMISATRFFRLRA